MRPNAGTLVLLIAATVSGLAIADDTSEAFQEYVARFDVALETPVSAETGASVAPGRLAYTPMTPCRLLDTRIPSLVSGRFAPGEQRDFLITHPYIEERQGGTPGCGVPLWAEAIAINVTGVEPSQRGFLTAWAFGEERPLAATLSLLPGENISNAITIPVDNDGTTEDFTIYAYVPTHVVADVVGYYSPIELEVPECYVVRDYERMAIEPGARRSALSPACNAGYTRMEGWCELSGQEDLVLIEASAANSRQRCDIRNIGTATLEARPTNRCCTVGGR